MDKFDLLLKKLVESTDLDISPDFLECLPLDVIEEHFNEGNYKIVAKAHDVDKHRWYETSVTVVEIYGRFLGCRHVTDLSGEEMSYEDCGFEPFFFEMVQVPSVTYQPKE